MKTVFPLFFSLFICASIPAQDHLKQLRQTFRDPNSNVVLVAAHRAVHDRFPENSIPAIREAIRLGVDIVEIDVKVTADGIPVLMHDRLIDRTTTGKGDPETMTFAALNAFNLVAGGTVTGEKIPTLEEALRVAKGHILVDLDLKTERIEPVLDIVRKTGTADQVFYFDSDYSVLHKVKKHDNRAMLMPRAYNHAMADSALRLFNPQVVHIDFKFYTAETVALIRSGAARIWINSLGKPDQLLAEEKNEEALQMLLANGANVVQTDHPEKLLALLREKGRRASLKGPRSGAVSTKKVRPAVAAHRGKSPGNPENTLRSIRKALTLGIRYVEVDVRTTRDGHLVVLHDGKVNRTTNRKGELHRFTLDEVRNFAITGFLGFRRRNAQIPEFADVCRLVSEWNAQTDTPVALYVDCKAAAPAPLLGILKHYELHREAVFYGSDQYLRALKQLLPEARVMPSLRDTAELDRKLKEIQPYALDVDYAFLNQDLVNTLHKKDVKVFTDLLFLKDSPRHYKRATAWGVDVIQSDRARKVRRVLDRL